MTNRVIDVRGRRVAISENGQGRPLIYLHGFADLHGVKNDCQPFHAFLGRFAHLIAPAHPGCAGSDELGENYGIEDVAFHYLEVFDSLNLGTFDLVGHCVGGWIAAELAVRIPERVRSLSLIGALGLFVSNNPTGDIFMHSQPERGVDLASLRNLMFAQSEEDLAIQYYPNARGALDDEVRRYGILRFGSFIGFKPPYFYRRLLLSQLYRAKMPGVVIWGEKDRMVSGAHGSAYAEELPNAGPLQKIKEAGHAVCAERPQQVANIIGDLVSRDHPQKP